MQVECGTDAAAAAAAALPWLENDPVVHNVPATVLAGLVADAAGGRPGPGAVWAIARDAAGAVAGLAVCNPPWPAVVAGPPAAAAALAARLAAAGARVTGVTGAVASAEAFAARWCAATGAVPGRREGLLIYRLDEVRPPAAGRPAGSPPGGVPGALRIATAADRALLAGWADAFDAEIDLGRGDGDGEAVVDARLRAGRLSVWDVAGRPVAMAATTPWIAGVPRINLVYTPPAERGRGYATALVAAVSARELAAGAVACTLNAEVGNATSNRIYRRIGYRQVAETVCIRLG